MFSVFKNIVIAAFIFSWVSCKQELKKYPLNHGTKASGVISDPINTLTSKIESLDVDYTAFGCACPNWIRTKDMGSVDKEGIKNVYFYIEPADENMDYRFILMLSGIF